MLSAVPYLVLNHTTPSRIFCFLLSWISNSFPALLATPYINVDHHINTLIFHEPYNNDATGLREAGTFHPARMPDGGFFLPLPGNKPPDFGVVMDRGCQKAISMWSTCTPAASSASIMPTVERPRLGLLFSPQTNPISHAFIGWRRRAS